MNSWSHVQELELLTFSNTQIKAYKNESIKLKEKQMVETPTTQTTKLKTHNPNELVSFGII
jgi:hypothetical protein